MARAAASDVAEHGTYAGVSAHERAGTELDRECLEARRKYHMRYTKLRGLGYDQVVPAGPAALEVARQLVTSGLSQSELAQASGLSPATLFRVVDGGVETRVYRRVRDRLESLDVTDAIGTTLTHVGCVRRLQAMAGIGYSARRIASETGLDKHVVADLQAGRATLSWGRTRRAVAEFDDRRAMTPAEPSPAATRARNLAERMGWSGPLAWDAVDDPRAVPQHGTPLADTFVDEAAVEQRLAGIRVPLSPAEATETVRRGYARGLSNKQLTQTTGLKPERHYKAGGDTPPATSRRGTAPTDADQAEEDLAWESVDPVPSPGARRERLSVGRTGSPTAASSHARGVHR